MGPETEQRKSRGPGFLGRGGHDLSHFSLMTVCHTSPLLPMLLWGGSTPKGMAFLGSLRPPGLASALLMEPSITQAGFSGPRGSATVMHPTAYDGTFPFARGGRWLAPGSSHGGGSLSFSPLPPGSSPDQCLLGASVSRTWPLTVPGLHPLLVQYHLPMVLCKGGILLDTGGGRCRRLAKPCLPLPSCPTWKAPLSRPAPASPALQLGRGEVSPQPGQVQARPHLPSMSTPPGKLRGLGHDCVLEGTGFEMHSVHRR